MVRKNLKSFFGGDKTKAGTVTKVKCHLLFNMAEGACLSHNFHLHHLSQVKVQV